MRLGLMKKKKTLEDAVAIAINNGYPSNRV